MNYQETLQFIQKCIETMGFSCDSVEYNILDNGSVVFSIQSNDSKYLMGRDGENIQFFQYLVRCFVEKNTKNDQKLFILLDINNYQKEKIEKIKAIAHTMAERSKFFQSSMELEPMNSFERHIVHEYLSNDNSIETKSEGFGKKRKVIIHYKKQ